MGEEVDKVVERSGGRDVETLLEHLTAKVYSLPLCPYARVCLSPFCTWVRTYMRIWTEREAPAYMDREREGQGLTLSFLYLRTHANVILRLAIIMVPVHTI